jgi:hypothetical protein
MKRALTVFVCFASFFCRAQTLIPLDSLTCIKLGSSKTAVVKAVTAHNGHWDTQHSQPALYLFDHIQFDSKSSSLLVVKFDQNRAYEADYILTPVKRLNALQYYFILVRELSKVYGKGKSADELKAPPANDKAWVKINDIKLGLASYCTSWPVNDHLIILTIDVRLNVILAVQDDKLTRNLFEQKKAE